MWLQVLETSVRYMDRIDMGTIRQWYQYISAPRRFEWRNGIGMAGPEVLSLLNQFPEQIDCSTTSKIESVSGVSWVLAVIIYKGTAA